MCIGVACCTENFSDNRGPALQCQIKSLENENSRTFAHDETIASGVKWFADQCRRQCRHVAETSECSNGGGAFCSTGDYSIAPTPSDKSRCITNCMCCCSTCCTDRFGWALKSVTHRNCCTGCIRHHHRNQEGRYASLTLFDTSDDVFLERAQSTNTGSKDGANARLVVWQFTRLGECFVRGSECKLLATI